MLDWFHHTPLSSLQDIFKSYFAFWSSAQFMSKCSILEADLKLRAKTQRSLQATLHSKPAPLVLSFVLYFCSLLFMFYQKISFHNIYYLKVVFFCQTVISSFFFPSIFVIVSLFLKVLHVDLLKSGTSHNDPKPAKTSRNEPIAAKTAQKKRCKTTRNDPKFQNWENMDSFSSFCFSNIDSKFPNLGILGQKVSTF